MRTKICITFRPDYMNKKNSLATVLMVAGETLIIICFLFFGKSLSQDVLILNIIVSSIIYSLYFVDILIPLVDLKESSHKAIGSLGIRWLVTIAYTIAAITAMVILNMTVPAGFYSQLLIHAILFFFLLLGLFSAFSASEKVKQVFINEKEILERINDMKKATKEVQLKMDQMREIPSEIIIRITSIQDNLRFISPSDNREAVELESTFINEMNMVKDCLFEIPPNHQRITEYIEHCERTCKERKQIFSN
jgi:hypothetical protein